MGKVIKFCCKKWKLNKYKQGRKDFYNYRVIELVNGNYIPCVLIKSDNKVQSLIDSKIYYTNCCNEIKNVYFVCDII